MAAPKLDPKLQASARRVAAQLLGKRSAHMSAEHARRARGGLVNTYLYPMRPMPTDDHAAEVNRESLRLLVDRLDGADLMALAKLADLLAAYPATEAEWLAVGAHEAADHARIAVYMAQQ